MVFWVVMPCCLAGNYRCVWGMYCLLQVETLLFLCNNLILDSLMLVVDIALLNSQKSISDTVTQLLTKFMEQSLEIDTQSSNQVPCILWNPKFEYCIHCSQPFVLILSQMNHTRRSHVTLHNITAFYCELLPLRRTPSREDHPLSAVRD
jgi:hypothetical protein